MRKWVYKLFSIVLCAIVVLASADVAFALPKKLPKLKGGKRPRITVPKTPVTRNLPPTPVVRPNVATQVERATAVQAAKAVTTAPVAPAHTLQETPTMPVVQDTGTKLKRTPEQVLAELESFIQERGRMPRSTIFRNGHPISRQSCTPQEMGELSLAQAFNHFIQKSTYADLLRFYRTTDDKGDYILEMEEVPDEELVPSVAQKVEEIAPVVPSPHTIRLRVTEQTKNLIESVREQTALEREKFSPWLESMTQSKNHKQIVNENTLNALSTLSRAINFDQQVHQNRRAVTYLLDTVNNYIGILGERKMGKQKNGYYYKLLYRGQVDPTELPIADNFHIVAEEKGMSWDGKLAPQVEEVKRFHAQAITNGTPFSIYLGRDGDMVTRLGIKYTADLQTVKKDLETTIQHLLPPGYTIRLGMHEIGISGQNPSKFHNGRVHLHLENASASPSDTGLQIDHSISLDIDMRPFAGNRDPHTHKFQAFEDKQIAQNYLALFDKFLDNEARKFLLNLIDTFH